MTRKANAIKTSFNYCEKEVSCVCKYSRVVPIVRHIIVNKADVGFHALIQTVVTIGNYKNELQKLDFMHFSAEEEDIPNLLLFYFSKMYFKKEAKKQTVKGGVRGSHIKVGRNWDWGSK